jgi:hypothetical protein
MWYGRGGEAEASALQLGFHSSSTRKVCCKSRGVGVGVSNSIEPTHMRHVLREDESWSHQGSLLFVPHLVNLNKGGAAGRCSKGSICLRPMLSAIKMDEVTHMHL